MDSLAPPARQARSARSARSARLPRRVRRGLLVAHLAVSVSWLGLTLCLLALGVTGATSGSAAAAAAAYRSMKVCGDWLLPPLALSTFATGLVLALGTPWGLARYRWVYLKFWLTLGAAAASLLVFRGSVNAAAADVAYAVLGPVAADLDAVVGGGDRSGVEAVLDDPRLAPLRPRLTGRVLPTPDPRLDVLRRFGATLREVEITLNALA